MDNERKETCELNGLQMPISTAIDVLQGNREDDLFLKVSLAPPAMVCSAYDTKFITNLARRHIYSLLQFDGVFWQMTDEKGQVYMRFRCYGNAVSVVVLTREQADPRRVDVGESIAYDIEHNIGNIIPRGYEVSMSVMDAVPAIN